METPVAKHLSRSSISTPSTVGAGQAPAAKLGARCIPHPSHIFLTRDDISQVKFRDEQQSLGSAWYGFSLIGGLSSRVPVVIVFTDFGNQDHVLIMRLGDGAYTLKTDDNSVRTTVKTISDIIDLFDENALPC